MRNVRGYRSSMGEAGDCIRVVMKALIFIVSGTYSVNHPENFRNTCLFDPSEIRMADYEIA